jgi:hypothetical protein
MLGTFSTRGVPHRSVGLTSLGHYIFHEDGTLEEIAITGCEENQEELLQVYEWSRAGDALVIVDMPDGDTFEEWLVTLGDTCNTLEVDQIQDGESSGGFPLTRGAVCMKELPPCPEGTSCDSCETVWCDEPPPPCGE